MPVWPPTSVCEGLAERVHGSTRALRNNPRYWTAPRASSPLWLLGSGMLALLRIRPISCEEAIRCAPTPPPHLSPALSASPRASRIPFPLLPSPPPGPLYAEYVTLFVIKFVIFGFCVVFVSLWYLFLCLKVTSCLSVSL